MAVEQVQAYVYVCDGCEKKVLAAGDETPGGVAGGFTLRDGTNETKHVFFACRKTHVAKAVKNVLNAASGEATQPWTGQAPDPTETDTNSGALLDGSTDATVDGGTESAPSPGDEQSSPPSVEGNDTAESAKPPRQRAKR